MSSIFHYSTGPLEKCKEYFSYPIPSKFQEKYKEFLERRNTERIHFAFYINNYEVISCALISHDRDVDYRGIHPSFCVKIENYPSIPYVMEYLYDTSKDNIFLQELREHFIENIREPLITFGNFDDSDYSINKAVTHKLWKAGFDFVSVIDEEDDYCMMIYRPEHIKKMDCMSLK